MITVITPSYNQAAYIEETIRSVLLQGCPAMEYIVIDGGSTDDSVSIIRKYEKWIKYWVSEPDNGQADAIQKGLARATGAVSAYLNSDDIYMPGALNRVGARFAREDADVVYGNLYRIDAEDRVVEEHRNTPFTRLGYLYGGFYLHQPSTLWKTDIVKRLGGFNSEFRFDMDNDLFVRLALANARFSFEPAFLAGFRIHPHSKTSTIIHVSRLENERIRTKYLSVPFDSPRAKLIRLGAFAKRLYWYTLQGDLGWLMRRALSKIH